MSDLAYDEITPQWEGHVPRGRWEWAARGHAPGDGQHVNSALPSVEIRTEEALRLFVQAAFTRFDRVELHHWYSGTELTFTRQQDGTANVARRQLRPTYGAPGAVRF